MTVLVTVAAARPAVAALAPHLVVQPASCLLVATATTTVAVTDVIATVLAARRPTGRTLAVVTAFVTLASLASLLAVYWATPLDFDYHVATSVRRVITAPVVFAAAMTPLLLARAQASR